MLSNLGGAEKEMEGDVDRGRGRLAGCDVPNAKPLYLFVGVVHVKKRQMVSVYVCKLGLRFVSLQKSERVSA